MNIGWKSPICLIGGYNMCQTFVNSAIFFLFPHQCCLNLQMGVIIFASKFLETHFTFYVFQPIKGKRIIPVPREV